MHQPSNSNKSTSVPTARTRRIDCAHWNTQSDPTQSTTRVAHATYNTLCRLPRQPDVQLQNADQGSKRKSQMQTALFTM
eukprot:scaffold224070_cov58-Attheya_sp.AAC.1